MPYHFTLKDNNQKSYRLFNWFLFFLHVVAASVAALQNPGNRVSMYVFLGGYLLILGAHNLFRKNADVSEALGFVLAFLYASFWYQQAGMIALVAFAVIYIAVTAVKGKRTTVLFTDEGIQLTRVFKTAVFPWGAMDNVILKDNLLTIDFKSNKILQVEIVEEGKAVDETEFNLFCKAQMAL